MKRRDIIVLLLPLLWVGVEAGAVITLGPGVYGNEANKNEPVSSVVGAGSKETVIECGGTRWVYADQATRNNNNFLVDGIGFEGCTTQGYHGAVLEIKGTLVQATARRCRFAKSFDGHAVAVTDGGRLMIEDSIFDSNSGGGIVVLGSGSIVLFERSILTRNAGPSLKCDDGGHITSSDSLISHNIAVSRPRTGIFADGGGAWVGANCTTSLRNVTFEGNEARPTNRDGCDSPDAGCLSGRGGAVHLFRSSNFECTDCTFVDNLVAAGTASRDGAQGGALFAAFGDRVDLIGCHFERNSARGRGENRHGSPVDGGAGDGGAIKMGYFGQLLILDTVFMENIVTAGVREPARGGALSLLFVDTALCAHCEFTTNAAYGGGLIVNAAKDTGVGGAFGGAASIVACAPTFHDSRFVGNVAETFGGLLAGVTATVLNAYGDGFDRLDGGTFSTAAGGGIHATAGATPVLVVDSHFEANSATATGHDVFVSGGRYSDTVGTNTDNETTYVDLHNCTFGPGVPAELLQQGAQKIFQGASEDDDGTQKNGAPDEPEEPQHWQRKRKFFPNYQRGSIAAWARSFFYFDAVLEASFAATVIEALEIARVASIGARVELESCGLHPTAARTGPLQVVVIGDAARSKKRVTCDAAEAQLDTSMDVKDSAQARFGSIGAHHSRNESISVLAVWADVIVGTDKNHTADVALSQLVLVGGSLFADSQGIMTIQHNIFLSDAAVVGEAAFQESQETDEMLVSELRNPVLRLLDGDDEYASILKTNLPGDSPLPPWESFGASSVLGRVGQLGRSGRVALCGVTVRVVAKSLVLDGADLLLRRHSRLEVGHEATLVLAGGDTTVVADVADGAVVDCNGTVARAGNEAKPSVLLLPNATFVHGGALNLVAGTDGVELRGGKTSTEEEVDTSYLFEDEPPLIDARNVIIATNALVNATLADNAVVSFASTWAIYSAQRIITEVPGSKYILDFDGLDKNASANSNFLSFSREPVIAGATRGVGLALAFLRVADDDDEVVLAATVDYVDCASRVAGQFAETPSANVYNADISPRDDKGWWGRNSSESHWWRGPPTTKNGDSSTGASDDDPSTGTSSTADTAPVGDPGSFSFVRDQCTLCLDYNSSCAFAFDAARSLDTHNVCASKTMVMGTSSSSSSYASYEYRSKNCCEHGCGPGGICNNGRCKCTWWWSGTRCTSLSLKARAVVALGLLAFLTLAAVATYVALWKRRKSAAIGLALDELRDNLLSDDRFSVGIDDHQDDFDDHRKDVVKKEVEEEDVDAVNSDPIPGRDETKEGDPFKRARSVSDLTDGETPGNLQLPVSTDPQPALAVPTTPESWWQSLWKGERSRSKRTRSITGNQSGPTAIDPSFLRDVRERLVLRDVLIKRSEVDIREKIGSGTFGDVYRAFYRGSEVAVKKLRLPKRAWTHAQLVEEVERFRAEAVLVSRVRHPNVVMTMGVVIERQDPGSRAFVSVSIEGHELVGLGADAWQHSGRGTSSSSSSWGSFFFGTGGGTFGPQKSSQRKETDYDLPQYGAQQQQQGSRRRPQVAPPPLLTLSIVTEYMALGSLSDLLYSLSDFQQGVYIDTVERKPPLPRHAWSHDLLLMCASQAARGMSYLHGRGIAHRDLKCANLVVDEHWRVKVCDYGSSRFVDHHRKTLRNRSHDNTPTSTVDPRLVSVASSTHLTQTTESTARDDGGGHMTADVGSMRWMAPETFGQPGKRVVKYGYPADVYSFGMCLFEMATRAPPWPDLRSRFDVADAVSSGAGLPLTADVPTAFRALYTACAHRDPSKRPTFPNIVDDLDTQRRDRTDVSGPGPYGYNRSPAAPLTPTTPHYYTYRYQQQYPPPVTLQRELAPCLDDEVA